MERDLDLRRNCISRWRWRPAQNLPQVLLAIVIVGFEWALRAALPDIADICTSCITHTHVEIFAKSSEGVEVHVGPAWRHDEGMPLHLGEANLVGVRGRTSFTTGRCS